MKAEQIDKIFESIKNDTFSLDLLPKGFDINKFALDYDENELDLYDEGIHLNGYNLLHVAIIYNKLDVVNMLINAGMDVNAKTDGNTGEDLWDYPRRNGMTPLMIAVDSGNKSIVKKLLAHKAKIDVRQKRNAGRTAFLWAVDKGYLEIAKLLLDMGDDINTQEIYKDYVWDESKKRFTNKKIEIHGETALMIAAKNADIPMLELLLKYSPNLEIEDEDKEGLKGQKITALQAVIFDGGQPVVLEMLIDAGAMCVGKKLKGKSLIEHAQQNFTDEIVQVLLSEETHRFLIRTLFSPLINGIIKSILSGQVIIPEDVQIEIPDLSCIKTWLQNGTIELINIENRLIAGDVIRTEIKKLLEDLCDIKAYLKLSKKNELKLDDLYKSTKGSWVLSNDRSLVTLDNSKAFSLQIALRRLVRLAYLSIVKKNKQEQNNTETIIFPKDAENNIFDKIETGTFLLKDLASEELDFNTLYYEDVEAKFNECDTAISKNGDTPLHAAVRFGDPNLVEMLSDVMDINTLKGQDHYGDDMTPLCLACQEKNLLLVRLLLEYGANQFKAGKCRRIPLQLAVESEDINIVKLLIDFSGTEVAQRQLVNVRDKYDDTASSYALKNFNPLPMLEILLKYKPNVSKLQEILNRTLFHPLVRNIVDSILKGEAVTFEGGEITIPDPKCVADIPAISKFEEDKVQNVKLQGDVIRLTLNEVIVYLLQMKTYLYDGEATLLINYQANCNDFYNRNKNDAYKPMLLTNDEVKKVETTLTNLVSLLKNFMLENSSEQSNEIRLACSAIASGNNFGSPVHHDKGKRKPTDELLPANTTDPKVTRLHVPK